MDGLALACATGRIGGALYDFVVAGFLAAVAAALGASALSVGGLTRVVTERTLRALATSQNGPFVALCVATIGATSTGVVGALAVHVAQLAVAIWTQLGAQPSSFVAPKSLALPAGVVVAGVALAHACAGSLASASRTTHAGASPGERPRTAPPGPRRPRPPVGRLVRLVPHEAAPRREEPRATTDLGGALAVRLQCDRADRTGPRASSRRAAPERPPATSPT